MNFRPPQCLGMVVVPTSGERQSFYFCFLPLLMLATLPGFFIFLEAPSARSSLKRNFGGTVIGNYA